jgi:hypothetical protein
MKPDLIAIRERAEKATPGPWSRNTYLPKYICQNKNNCDNCEAVKRTGLFIAKPDGD